VFGRRWDASIVPLQALSLYAAFRSLGIGYVDVLKAVGRTRLMFSLGVLRLVVVLPALLIAVQFGINGVSWAQAAGALVLAVVVQAVAIRVLGVPARSLAAALVPALAVAVGVAIGGGAVRLFMPGPEALRLTAAVAASMLVGGAAVQLVDPGFLRETLALVLRRNPSARAATA
jgi:O-antigen/teichoic acid export membrane protein